MLTSCLLVLEANRQFNSSHFEFLENGRKLMRRFLSEGNLSDFDESFENWENSSSSRSSTLSLPKEIEKLENVVWKLKKRQNRINAALSVPSLTDLTNGNKGCRGERGRSTSVLLRYISFQFIDTRNDSLEFSSARPIDVDQEFPLSDVSDTVPSFKSSEIIDVDENVVLSVIRDLETPTYVPIMLREAHSSNDGFYISLSKPLVALAPVTPPPSTPKNRQS